MNETSKCKTKRVLNGDFERYLFGSGIDIGCGGDCLTVPNGSVRPWDKKDGDAQTMAGLADSSFDFVYSSHCLEHLIDVEHALRAWVRILKPRGRVYIVVPDYLYYEKMTWPSRFNGDHKHSFSETVGRSQVGRENHWNIAVDLAPVLRRSDIAVREARLETDGYDFNRGMEDQTMKLALSQIVIVGDLIDPA